ncbi:Flagellum-specific peptidoglycan hydrolase FlgJ [Lachnospiraceae bacterium]|nr:Flagellum-specific peptidoglycan hydrolase FlgJ [Lachnospiraceae bacterium]
MKSMKDIVKPIGLMVIICLIFYIFTTSKNPFLSAVSNPMSRTSEQASVSGNDGKTASIDIEDEFYREGGNISIEDYAYDAASSIISISDALNIQASDLIKTDNNDIISMVGSRMTKEQERTGILASVLTAQFIYESGYGKESLALNTNNCFGMKCDLSDMNWEGGTWDGTRYSTNTIEEDSDGIPYSASADFRSYDTIEDSIIDHSAYLLGAMAGSRHRYAGIQGETDYRTAASIIKKGGYATDTSYVDSLCDIIEKYDLTRFDM